MKFILNPLTKCVISGELNEHLVPETREQFYLRHSTIDDDDIAEWGMYIEPNPKPGSAQRKQLYSKAVRFWIIFIKNRFILIIFELIDCA